MKNIQVIDGAANCAYDIFQATDEEFLFIFPCGTDIEFIDDLVYRVGEDEAYKVLDKIWPRKINKKSACGIHGTLFYELPNKKKYYPTKHETDLI